MFYGDSVKDEIEKRKKELKEKVDRKFSWFRSQKSSAIEKESSGLSDVEVHGRNQKQSQNEVMNSVIQLLEARNGNKVIKINNEKQNNSCQSKKLNYTDSDFIQHNDVIFFKKMINQNITNQTMQSKNLKNKEIKDSNFNLEKKTKLIDILKKYSFEVIGKEAVEQGSGIINYGVYEPVKRKEKKEINDKMKYQHKGIQQQQQQQEKGKGKGKGKEKVKENQGMSKGQEKDKVKQPPQSTVLMDQACMILSSAARIRSHLSNPILKFKPNKVEKLELLREEEFLNIVAGSYCVITDPGSGLLIRNYAVDSLNSLSLIVGARNEKLELQKFLSSRG